MNRELNVRKINFSKKFNLKVITELKNYKEVLRFKITYIRMFMHHIIGLNMLIDLSIIINIKKIKVKR